MVEASRVAGPGDFRFFARGRDARQPSAAAILSRSKTGIAGLRTISRQKVRRASNQFRELAQLHV